MRIDLIEGISPTVYHFTQLYRAYDIITSGEFKLSPAFSSEVEEEYSDDVFYLSTTRSRLGSYHVGSSAGVLFELDGRRLANNNKGKSVDYWGKLNKDSEFEDRVYSSSFTLPIKGTITGIEIVVGDNTTHPVVVKVVKFLYIYAKKNKIPCKVYHSMSGLKVRNRKDLYSHSEIMALDAEPVPTLDYSKRQDFKSMATPEKNDLYNFVEIYYKDYDKLSAEAKQMYTDIIRSSSKITSLRGAIKTASASMRNELSDKMLKRIGKIIKIEGVSTFNELYTKIKNRIAAEDKIRQKKYRDEIQWNIYHKNQERFEHVLNALKGTIDFDRTMFDDDDYKAMHQLTSAVDTLTYLNLIPDDAKERWIDPYGGISDHAYEFLFKIKPY